MEQEKKVISKLALNSRSEYIDGELMHCIKNDDVKKFAESIVKLFAIPDVVQQRELLVDFKNWWYGNRREASWIHIDEIDKYLGNQ